MKTTCHLLISISFFYFIALESIGCTIFAAKKNQIMLFGNNEAWISDSTKIWFLSGEVNKHNRAFWGFNNGWTQGGINEKGLFYDWVSGYPAKWINDPQKPFFAGNLFERILEKSCSVDEALIYISKFNEYGFSVGRCFLADRNKAVILKWENGFLEITEMTDDILSLGYNDIQVANSLKEISNLTPESAGKILNQHRQYGNPETKYSLVINPITLEIFLFDFRKSEKATDISLKKEWSSPNHFYHIPKIETEIFKKVLLTDSKAFNEMKTCFEFQITRYSGDYLSEKLRISVKEERDTLWVKVDSIQNRYYPVFRMNDSTFSLRFIDWTFGFQTESASKQKIIFRRWQDIFQAEKIKIN